MPNVIPAFIFDLDGVITDTARYHFEAWKRLANSVGVSFDEDDNEQLKGVGRRESLEFILARSDAEYSEDEIQQLMTQKNDDYVTSIEKMGPHDLLPGVHDLLTNLRKRGHKTGLASASKNAARVLSYLNITDMFDYVADAAIIPNSKPAPDVFLDVAKAFSMDSADCIGIEDAAAGVQAIKSAQMVAIGIGEQGVLAQADHVYARIAEFNIDDVLAIWKKHR